MKLFASCLRCAGVSSSLLPDHLVEDQRQLGVGVIEPLVQVAHREGDRLTPQ